MIEKLAENYGLGAVCVSLIGLIGWIVKLVLEMVKNHLKHNTEATVKMIEKLKQDIEIGKETHSLLRNLNGKK